MNTALYLYRCCQIGLSMSDLELLSIGLVNDMFIESKNDEYDYPYLASDEDIENL